MEYLGIACIVLAGAVFWWLVGGGPQELARQRRLGREADARAEEARTERAKLERDKR